MNKDIDSTSQRLLGVIRAVQPEAAKAIETAFWIGYSQRVREECRETFNKGKRHATHTD